jgi:hypothetical protein
MRQEMILVLFVYIIISLYVFDEVKNLYDCNFVILHRLNM